MHFEVFSFLVKIAPKVAMHFVVARSESLFGLQTLEAMLMYKTLTIEQNYYT